MANLSSLSIFTPSNNTQRLNEAWTSIEAQTDKDFEWVILLNGDANEGDLLSTLKEDKRVAIYYAQEGHQNFVGALKKQACSFCVGAILLELDHDDLLLPNAVEEVKKAFVENPSVGFVYSNAIYATGDLKPVKRFGNGFGWEWKQHEMNGHLLDEIISFPPTATNVGRIWYAPDHLRAFRHSVYNQVGGYASDMRVLDDQDLMSRLFQRTRFHHINKPLYIYRIFGNNTWQTNNAEIQNNVMRIYNKYAEDMMMAEAINDNYFVAKRNRQERVELGGRMNSTTDYITVDIKGDVDIKLDLNGPWSCFEDSSVGLLKAIDTLEHLKDPIHVMKEAYRVLRPGGYFIIQVPSTDGRGAFQDPTHVSFWNENSFLYYTHKNWARFIDTPVRFQAVKLFTTEKDARGVCWVQAHLVSLKDGFRPPGEIHI